MKLDSQLLNYFAELEATEFADALQTSLDDSMAGYTHGELSQWLEMITALPELEITELDLLNTVNVIGKLPLDEIQKTAITEQLMILHPWRKGPFNIHGIEINTEWRSDWKWQRIAPYLPSLKYKKILDVGCGNGYHLFRMMGAGAEMALGIDTSQKFYAQFLALKHFIGKVNAHLVPIGIERMPLTGLFDMVFSMGVLYHRKNPIEHINQLKALTTKGGQIVLETLVIDGDEQQVLVPKDRYAQMRNVWFIPSSAALENWLKRCDLKDIQLLDCNRTTTEEQRQTDWMHFHSLANYLDPEDSTKTVEGYPSPQRATFIATVA